MSTELPDHGRYEHPCVSDALEKKIRLSLPIDVVERRIIDMYPDLATRRNDVRANAAICLAIACPRGELLDLLLSHERRERVLTAVSVSCGKF
jgi:hypothetical protein